MSTNTQLSSTITVTRYRELERADDRLALSKFIIQRFDERYFLPIESIPKESKHGFITTTGVRRMWKLVLQRFPLWNPASWPSLVW
jgi:hypothetical protein